MAPLLVLEPVKRDGKKRRPSPRKALLPRIEGEVCPPDFTACRISHASEGYEVSAGRDHVPLAEYTLTGAIALS
jgi:hypothetical protein